MRRNLTAISYEMRRALVAVSIALAGILATSVALAQRKYDTATLPPYCKYTQYYRENVSGGNDPAQIARWARVLGEQNFIHLHHYCFGLENSNQALYFSRTRQERDV